MNSKRMLAKRQKSCIDAGFGIGNGFESYLVRAFAVLKVCSRAELSKEPDRMTSSRAELSKELD
ncbi:hypothetical protein [Paenibacillus radicis (ex Xue et al. 2023)]|uniref:Uncharacterized protein n=1 Tax=Paenibacillus radicis (ex Xue et al. 2023) TaxID=2972489 RepID=A0ABT1YVB3_9BACL|nr:hypothetical protein [Paenibacillus radicis (ex Xue et al. 2023)]MCR8636887.1 hypothetical protein [Paenibacillus radicis (ex Xue et al. 2023)]